MDYDKVLELAQDHRVTPILDLIHWSENYGWNNPSNPLYAFYAIARIEDYDFDIPSGASYGFHEIHLIGQALECYATRPNDVVQFLEELQRMESEEDD